jgi:hypothetical protein
MERNQGIRKLSEKEKAGPDISRLSVHFDNQQLQPGVSGMLGHQRRQDIKPRFVGNQRDYN